MAEESLLRCEQCQRVTRARRKQRSGFYNQLVAFILFLVGISLLLASPPKPPLAVPAVLMLAMACWIRFRRVTERRCEACGARDDEPEALRDVQRLVLHPA